MTMLIGLYQIAVAGQTAFFFALYTSPKETTTTETISGDAVACVQASLDIRMALAICVHHFSDFCLLKIMDYVSPAPIHAPAFHLVAGGALAMALFLERSRCHKPRAD
jgi:hypothetical protein